MKFIDLATVGDSRPIKYVLGLLLIFFLYFIGSLGIMVDITLNFPQLQLTSLDFQFYETFGYSRFLFWMLVPYVFVFIGLLFYVVQGHKRTLLSAFTRMVSFRWKRFAFSFLLLFILMIGMTFIQIYIDHAMGSRQFTFQLDWGKFLPLFGISLMLLPIQTACEELIFRSYLLQGLKLRLKRTGLSILISSMMFGLMHIGNPEIQKMGYHMLIYYGLSGLFLALITVVDDGLELAIGYHFANNFFAAIFVTSDWQVFRTDALFISHENPGNGWMSLLFLCLLLPSIFWLFKRVFHWPSWKEIWQSM